MEINNTRKEIINLISDYMDKTLSEGCLTEYINTNEKYRFIKKTISNGNMLYHFLTKSGKIYDEDSNIGNRYYHKEGRDYKILGHYDITAVLKYISSKGYEISYYSQNNTILIKGEYIYGVNDYGFIRFIPNKPIHLYNEKEEKALLDLLVKIK